MIFLIYIIYLNISIFEKHWKFIEILIKWKKIVIEDILIWLILSHN